MSKITLTEERYAQLLDAERQLINLIPEYDKLEECGADCAGLRQVNLEAINRIQRIKSNYPAPTR